MLLPLLWNRKEPMETISRKDLAIAWLAGMVDADGCISFHRNYQNRRTIRTSHRIPYTQVTTTCTKTAAHLKELYKELEIPYHMSIRSNGGGNRKPVYNINVQGLQRSLKIIPLILPYLVTKKREAELVLEFIAIRQALYNTKKHDPREEAISEEMRQLKANRNIVKNPQRLYARLH